MRRGAYLVGVGGLVGLHLYLLLNLRFEAWPEMLAYPHLLVNGFELYREMVYHYTPGVAWALGGWMSWRGVSPESLQQFTWGVILLVDLLVGVIAWRRWGRRAALVALVALVALQPLFDGNGLWYELALTPVLLLAFYRQSPFILGFGLVIKQSVFWFFPTMLRRWRRLAVAVAAVMVGLSGWFWLRGSLTWFWFWPFRFIFTIFPSSEGYRDLASWRHWVLPVGALGGVVALKLVRERSLRWLGESRDPALWLMLALPLGWPRFGLFHWQPAVAFAALVVGSVAGEVGGWVRGRAFRAVVVGAGLVVVLAWVRLVRWQWGAADRFLEPQVYQQAAQVALGTDADRPVLLLNTSEAIYALADRLPPKPWLTQFPWFLDLPGFQEYLVEEFRAQELEQVVVTPYGDEGPWIPGSYRPEVLLEYVRELGHEL